MDKQIKEESKYEIDDVKFDFYTPNEIKKISVQPLTSTMVYNQHNIPGISSLHDPVMGVSAFEMRLDCELCNQNAEKCTGHFGHIELTTPLYNPYMMNQILKLLNVKCFNCHQLKLNQKDQVYFFMKLFLIKFGLYEEAESLSMLLYESFNESTAYLYNKIVLFINDNLAKNKFLVKTDEESERHSSVDTHDSSTNKKLKEKKKKKQTEEEEKIEQAESYTQNKAVKTKKRMLKEMINKIFKKQKEIIEEKPSLVYQPTLTSNTASKQLESEFWKSAKLNKCSHCGATGMKFRKVNNVKFFQVMLSERERVKMEKTGIDTQKDALEHGASARIKKKQEKIKEKKKKKASDPINEFKPSKKTKQTNKNNMEFDEDKDIDINDDEDDDVDNTSDSENEDDEINDGNIQQAKQKFLHALEVKEHIVKLFKYDSGFLSLFFGNMAYTSNNEFNIQIVTNAPSLFFLEFLIVPPNRFRPENKSQGDQGVFLHQQTQLYLKILTIINDIRELSLKLDENKPSQLDDANELDSERNKLSSTLNQGRSSSYFEDLVAKWIQLQSIVNLLFDSTKSISKKDQEGKGIRQLIEKKEGILRMKMMGKRVNHAGRTVISPDPNLETSEVGVPLYLASKLYYPDKVTRYNSDFLKTLIKNGPYKYPGASQVSDAKRTISLANLPEESRSYIADSLKEGQIVKRNMQNGDILLFNRQPTLHKPSIMSHKAKILKNEKTLRFHYSNCSSYNADFDGDEMNIHFLQNEIAREEAYKISNSNNQYIVPTSGKPLRGLIQDSVDSSVYLTMKDTFFTREEYCNLVYSSLENSLNGKKIRKIILVHPAILKPKVLFTGKQIISTIIYSLCTSHHIDYIANAKMSFEHMNKLGKDIWGKGNEMEGIICIKDNEMLTGVLDKNDIGASDYGLIHSLFEIYGSELTGELITTLGKLFLNYLQSYHGFTCSVVDVVFKDETNLKRRVDIEKMLMSGMQSLGKFLDVKDCVLDFDNYSKRSVRSEGKELEKVRKLKVSKEEKKEMRELIQLQEKEVDQLNFNYYSMKTSNNNMEDDQEVFNASYKKIKELRDKYESIVLKDDSLEANIDTVVKNTLNEQTSNIPKNWLGKGLIRPFPNNTFAMMVKSGAKGSVVNHTLITCLLGQQELEGRRVPRMPSGKTLPSFEAFDPNPRAGGYVTDRFSTGIRPQEFFFHCMAGREGLIDTAVKTSRSGYMQRCLMKHLEELIVGYDYTVRDNDGNVIQFYYGEDSVDTSQTKYLTNFKFIAENIETYMQKYKPERLVDVLDTSSVKKSIKNKEMNEKETLLNKYEPWKYLGAVSEKVYEKMNNYLVTDPDKKFKENANRISKSQFKNVIFLKYLNSLIQPGESVGVLASQSIGEPSTQMTLNTFHLAGHGGANVTLGIPRLREILMTSEKNIKTPIMTLPVLSKDIKEIQKLARKFENYKLIDLIKEVKMKQAIKFSTNKTGEVIYEKYRGYSIEIIIEKIEDIIEYFNCPVEDIILILKSQFIPNLAKNISRYLRLGGKKQEVEINKEKDDNGNNNNTENDDNTDEEGNQDNYELKQKRKDSSEGESSEKENEDEDENKTDNKNNEEEDDDGTNNTNENEKTEERDEDDDQGTGSEMEIDDGDEKVNKESNKKQNKRKKEQKDAAKEALETTMFVYNDITIEKMEINHEEESAIFSFDLIIPYKQKNILLKNILDQVLRKINFKSIKNIKRCHILDKTNKAGEKEYILQLEGFNFNEVKKYADEIAINRIGTNDIGGILSIYGIEACRSAIVKEIVNVFDAYSINVDNRHLGLIADYITFQGKYRSFSRKGIGCNSSPWLKMTYETTMEFLIDACQSKIVDKCKTPSARIVIGRNPLCGTGAFDLIKDNIFTS